MALAGKFSIDGDSAREWLLTANPHGKPNSDVLRPIYNGVDITKRYRGLWVIDFGPSMNEKEAALYEAPFAHVVQYIKPVRITNRRRARAENWWRHGEPRPGMRNALSGLSRYIVTSEKSKHRFFTWLSVNVAPDNRLIVIPREDDETFGILSSKFHVLWALAVGSTLEDRPSYATTTCFEAFTFPDGLTLNLLPNEYSNPHSIEIADAARILNELRENWLSPPEWVEKIPEVVTGYPDQIVVKPEHKDEINKRTLTNLYNAMPAWLQNAHKELDQAVADAYGWDVNLTDEEILQNLLKLNQERVAPLV